MDRFLSYFYILGYISLIAPPRVISNSMKKRGYEEELSKVPLFVLMVVELIMRIALLVTISLIVEGLVTKSVYKAFHLDLALSVVVSIGIVHSFFCYLFLGNLRHYIGLARAMRCYRFVRNICYSGLPGLAFISPLVIHKWVYDQPPFADGKVLEIYLFTSLFMLVAGILEAAMVKRKPLGLDKDIEDDTEDTSNAFNDNEQQL